MVQGFPKASRSASGHASKNTGQMTLVREATFHGDHSQRPFKISQQPAGSTHLLTLLVFSGSLSLDPAEDSCHVHRVDSGLTGQIAHTDGLAEFFFQPLFDAPKPRRRQRFRLLKSREGPKHLQNASLQSERIRV